MKKVCCIFFICLVILSGLSIPTFAVSIGNCTEKKLLPLKIATNAMFDNVVNSKEERWDCGQLLDFISYSDLLSEFYMTKCKFKEVDQYRVKKCVFQSALIKSMCYDCTDTKFVDLELYFLKKATDILENTMKFYEENQKMFNLISKL